MSANASPNGETPTVVAVLGLGEAGGAIAGDLARAGASVRGYDPAPVPVPDGVTAADSEADAARGADLVLSVNSASAASGALRAGMGALPPHGVWADLNTASPGAKRDLARTADEHGTAFADVAIMAPVPGRGLRVPMLASGPGAGRTAQLLTPLGAFVDCIEGEPGTAAERKLLRSVFFKGLAAAVVEALAAGRAAGCEGWVRENIARELQQTDASTLDRLVDGTRKHAVRRTSEMAAAAAMLDELGVQPFIAAASRDLLAQLVSDEK
ncbi:NAD(P)-dependent oxidoreductase [Streptomyces albidus (ex Kaewkla and Franco 2022)]|uniref:NAD(P)-dependent oxidoreductase n=1 Tax=Streptomyces albidus (ex Kaewkla and Franco 2022) TaxID=722709 RepID=UPI0015EE7F85|nr:NAD(P)-dependent oxidoreductase [Streptomyces albidus (ex Kaewkla and Franco 2022)]